MYFSQNEVRSQFVTNMESLLEESTLNATVVGDATPLWAGRSTMSLVRNYCVGGQQNSWRSNVDRKGAVRLMWWRPQRGV